MPRRPTIVEALLRLFPDAGRDECYAAVMCGEVRLGDETVIDPKRTVDAEASLTWDRQRYVSRGGYKLEAALAAWALPVEGRVFLDAGASTGGFTDCLLQHGATYVHAVDVGYNQLDYRLRSDPRVGVHERRKAQDIAGVESPLDPPPDAFVCDLSFRSLIGIVDVLLSSVGEAWGVALLKPQFEAAALARWGELPDATDILSGEDGAGVLSSEAAEEISRRVMSRLAGDGVPATAMMASPLFGSRGNREYLVLFGRPPGYPSAAEGVNGAPI